MQAQTQLETPVLVQEAEASPRWNLATRVAFRFAFVYWILYCLPFPINYVPFVGYYSSYYESMWRTVVPWVAKHILHLSYDITIFTNGSGDTTYDYVRVLCFIVLAATAAAVWSVLDRKRLSYPKLDQWLRLGVRFWLAYYLINYGAMKQTQFSFPGLSKLLEPYGDFSSMGVLWNFMGASQTYTYITGLVELSAGILLIVPRMALVGALLSLVATTQVWLLNMCYDVPVKLFSFHLVVASLFLLGPQLRRIVNAMVFNRRVEPTRAIPFFRRQWLNWGFLALQVMFGAYLVYSFVGGYYQLAKRFNHPERFTPMYGIWDVEEFSVDGEVKPPLITDESRWRRVLLERPGGFTIHSMSGTPQGFRLQLNQENKTMTLSNPADQNWKAELAFEEPEPGRMTIVGEINGRKTQAKLVRYDENKFFLKSRGFTWTIDRPGSR